MIITYTKKGIPFDFKRIDKIEQIRVIKKAFTQGGLTYYKVNCFEYKAIPTEDVISEL